MTTQVTVERTTVDAPTPAVLRRLAHPGRPAAAWLTAATLAPVLAALVGIAMIAHATRVRNGDSTYYFGENRAGTYTNVALLVACAAAAHATARRTSAAADPAARRFWTFNAAAFAFLAADDQFSIHENLDKGVHWLFGMDPRHKVTTHLDDLIVLDYGVALLCVWWRHRATVLRHPWMIWAMAAGGAQFATMVAFDLFHLGKGTEEILKMSASATIAAALLEPTMNTAPR
jgi:hypothetical protein